MQQSLNVLVGEDPDVVRVVCIQVLQDYLASLPSDVTRPLQSTMIDALSNYFAGLDPNELDDSDELMVTLAETLRDVIALNTSICLSPVSNALGLLFTVGSRAPNNFQLSLMLNETLEEIARTIAGSGASEYARLCAIVLPSLTGAFDVGGMTGENSLTNVRADERVPNIQEGKANRWNIYKYI